jgi:para-nitrobenzyl esterase
MAWQVLTVLETGRGSHGPMSEDCLTLNVWTPEGAGRSGPRLPVLVWVHGGAFVNGAGSLPWYDGSALAARGDVVVVTINYRLGVFGFLDLAEVGGTDYEGSGNLGLLDQIAALSWVHENIAGFGGDPNTVCIVGESAGAMCVGTLLATDAAKGLFHRAIMQSGTPVAQQRPGSIEIAAGLFAKLGLPWTRAGLDRLCELPASELLAAADHVSVGQQAGSLTATAGSFACSPVVDGVVLGGDPMAAVWGGASATVPVLVGTTADEMRIIRVLAPDLAAIGHSELESRLNANWGPRGMEILAGYEALYPGAGADDLWWSIMSDQIFGLPTAGFIDARAHHGAATWAYQFAWRSPVRDGHYGAAHTMEIPFVFGGFNAPGATQFLGEITEEMQALAAGMQDAWIAFASTGRPGVERLPAWPPVHLDARPTMVFDEECGLVESPGASVRKLWDRPSPTT